MIMKSKPECHRFFPAHGGSMHRQIGDIRCQDGDFDPLSWPPAPLAHAKIPGLVSLQDAHSEFICRGVRKHFSPDG